MTAQANLYKQQQIMLNGVGTLGFALEAEPSVRLPYKAGDTWEINFYAKQLISDQQISSLAKEMQSDAEIVSLTHVTERHLRAIVKWLGAGRIFDSSERELAGVRYTMTAKPYEEKTLSTGAMFGLGVVSGVAVVGGIVYVATRKKKRRRRAA